MKVRNFNKNIYSRCVLLKAVLWLRFFVTISENKWNNNFARILRKSEILRVSLASKLKWMKTT